MGWGWTGTRLGSNLGQGAWLSFYTNHLAYSQQPCEGSTRLNPTGQTREPGHGEVKSRGQACKDPCTQRGCWVKVCKFLGVGGGRLYLCVLGFNVSSAHSSCSSAHPAPRGEPQEVSASSICR